MILHPLVIPLLAGSATALVAYFAFSGLRRRGGGGRSTVLVLITMAVAAAVVPNVGQQLYGIGFSMAAIDALAIVSYAVFGFSITGARVLLQASLKRWFLIALIPIPLAQPILSTFALIVWSTRGFAP